MTGVGGGQGSSPTTRHGGGTGTWTAKDVQPQGMTTSRKRDGHEDRKKPVFDFTHFLLALAELAYKM